MAYTKQTWVDNDPTLPVSAARMGHIESGIDAASVFINVKDVAYGAKGDGVTDDTAAINAAIAAASVAGGGVVLLPLGTYMITASLVLKDDVTVAISSGATVKWNSGTPGSMFSQSTAGTVNSRQAVVGYGGGYGKIDPSLINVTVFDLHSPQVCQIGHLYINNAGPTSTILKIRSDVTTAGGIGGTTKNSVNNQFFDLFCLRAGTLVDAQGSGSNVITNNTFSNLVCYDIRVKGFIAGPSFDTNRVSGEFFVSLGENNAIGVDFAADIATYDNSFDNVVVDSFPGWSGRVGLRFGAASRQNVIRWFENNPAAEGGPLITTGATSWLIEAGDWVEPGTASSALSSNSRLSTRVNKYQALAYSASITPDAALASPDVFFEVFVTTGAAFTMNAPTNASLGATIVFNFANNSGGACGAITWNAAYFLTSAFVGPPNNTYKSITFFWNNANWVETGRSG